MNVYLVTMQQHKFTLQMMFPLPGCRLAGPSSHLLPPRPQPPQPFALLICSSSSPQRYQLKQSQHQPSATMPFNRASINDWKTKPGDVRFLDIFVGQNQLDIRTGHMIRSKAKKVSSIFTTEDTPSSVPACQQCLSR